MTLDDFLDLFDECKYDLNFQVTHDYELIRAPCLLIDGRKMCPITAVSLVQGHMYDLIQFARAARDLGLSETDCANITYAADNRTYAIPAIRKRLMSGLPMEDNA